MADIAVVVPAYNATETLARAVRSVIAQEQSNWELIIVDDGSTDDPQACLSEFVDPRVRVITVSHGGVARARNAGWRASEAPLIAFLDADDAANPTWLSELVSPFADRRVALVVAGFHRRLDGNAMTDLLPSSGRLEVGGVRFHVLAGAFAVRRQVLDSIGGYDERLRFGENSDLGERMTKRLTADGSRVVAIEQPLVTWYRASRRNHGDRDGHRLEAAEALLASRSREMTRGQRSSLHRIAAVNALRVGSRRRAYRHAVSALATAPLSWRSLRTLVGVVVRRQPHQDAIHGDATGMS